MQKEVNSLDQLSGIFHFSDWDIIEVVGPDSCDFLHRLSSANIKALQENHAVLGSFLSGKGALIGFGYFYRVLPNSFWIILGPHQSESVLAHLQQYHFQENLLIQRKASDEIQILGGLNTSTELFKQSWSDSFNPSFKWILRDSGEPVHHFIPFDRYHLFRIHSGIPYWGWEVFEGELILETGLDRAVASNKGCYPGQEVVERILSYGQVNWTLLRVELESEKALESGPCLKEVVWRGKVVGHLRSVAVEGAQAKSGWGLARLSREVWDVKEKLMVGQRDFLKINKD